MTSPFLGGVIFSFLLNFSILRSNLTFLPVVLF